LPQAAGFYLPLLGKFRPIDRLSHLQVGDQTVLFPAASVFVNLMNAYEKPDIDPKLKELAEYAKQKVPEEHPKVNGPPYLPCVQICVYQGRKTPT